MIPSSPANECSSTQENSITGFDVATALSYLKLSDFETRYIRAKYLNAESLQSGSGFYDAILAYSASLAIELDWDQAITAKLVRMAIRERTDCSFTRCKRCHGTGITRTRSQIISCPHCDGVVMDENSQRLLGNGRRHISGREYARLIEVHHTTFKTTWLSRMLQIHAHLINIEIKARQLAID